MRVTLKRIAEMAETSAATVSLVLNGKQYHRVSPATREKIQEIARKLNYRPNLKAQALAKGKTGNIAILTSSIENPFYNLYLTRLQNLLEPAGYTVFPFETRLSPERERKIINWLNQGYFDGCICLELNTLNLEIQRQSHGLPMVSRGWSGIVDEPTPSIVTVDYREAIGELFRHLAESGSRKLAITIDVRDASGDPRQLAVRKAVYLEWCGRLPLTIPADGWIEVPFENGDILEFIYRRTLTLLRRAPEIDTILVQSARDVLAVYRAAAEAGRTVGRDLSVATFDRIPLLSFLTPETTHIMEPFEEIAETLAGQLLARLADREPAPPAEFHARLIRKPSTQLSTQTR